MLWGERVRANAKRDGKRKSGRTTLVASALCGPHWVTAQSPHRLLPSLLRALPEPNVALTAEVASVQTPTRTAHVRVPEQRAEPEPPLDQAPPAGPADGPGA